MTITNYIIPAVLISYDIVTEDGTVLYHMDDYSNRKAVWDYKNYVFGSSEAIIDWDGTDKNGTPLANNTRFILKCMQQSIMIATHQTISMIR